AGSPSSSRSTPRYRRRRPSSATSGACPRLTAGGRAPFRISLRIAMSEDRLRTLLDEYAALEAQLADPAIHADQAAARRVGRRFAELAPIHKAAAELRHVREDIA